MTIRSRLARLETALSAEPDGFDGVTIRDLIHWKDRLVEQIPGRVARAATYTGIFDLRYSLAQPARVAARTPEDTEAIAAAEREAAEARALWELPPEGPIDYLELAKREGLTPSLLDRLARELEGDTTLDDPDAPVGVPGIEPPDFDDA
jgi:hypothetical protein